MERPGFSFLVSPDSALIKLELEKLLQSWPGSESAKRLTFWGDGEPGDAFWRALDQVGVFAEKRIVIVRQAEIWPANVWKQVSSALSRELEHVWPFFCIEVEAERGQLKIPAYIQKSRCFSFADRKRWVWRSPGLGNTTQRFVAAEAKRRGLTFEEGSLATFCANCARDAQGILTELDKLSLLATDGKIKAEWLQAGESSQENNAFTIIRQLSAGDLPGAWQAISADADGSLLFFAVALWSREFRVLWQILAGEEPRLYSGEATRKRELARRLGYAGVSRGFVALADAEWQVKSGGRTPGQAMESLSIEMASIFNGGR